MAKLTLRIDLEGGGAIGPGKARLLELIHETGSLAAAARGLRMSYRRAWLLVDSLEQSFGQDMTSAQAGGRSGGRTELTEAGHAILATYRAAEKACLRATAKPLAALEALVRSKPHRNHAGAKAAVVGLKSYAKRQKRAQSKTAATASDKT